MSAITTGKYKDVEALILESDVLRVALLPEFGSKIASIVYKPLSHELLWQNPGREYTRTRYGNSYLAGELSGFDEMFPTIAQCHYEDYPWAGTELPDHGEVWSIPWDYTIKEDHLALRVDGVRLPYTLSKTVRLNGPELRMEYQAVNRSSFPLDFIWAGHPLFNASPGMEIVAPRGMTRIVNSVPGRRLDEYGREYDFPVARLSDGTEFNLASVPQRNPDYFQKYYFLGKVTEGRCSLHDKARGLTITLEFPPETVSYLGMLVNEGGFENQYNIAPEPATGAMDRIDRARMWGMNSVLKPKETKQWWIAISVFPDPRGSSPA
jgi:galactose mutarotase-like enzyme